MFLKLTSEHIVEKYQSTRELSDFLVFHGKFPLMAVENWGGAEDIKANKTKASW